MYISPKTLDCYLSYFWPCLSGWLLAMLFDLNKEGVKYSDSAIAVSCFIFVVLFTIIFCTVRILMNASESKE